MVGGTLTSPLGPVASRPFGVPHVVESFVDELETPLSDRASRGTKIGGGFRSEDAVRYDAVVQDRMLVVSEAPGRDPGIWPRGPEGMPDAMPVGLDEPPVVIVRIQSRSTYLSVPRGHEPTGSGSVVQNSGNNHHIRISLLSPRNPHGCRREMEMAMLAPTRRSPGRTSLGRCFPKTIWEVDNSANPNRGSGTWGGAHIPCTSSGLDRSQVRRHGEGPSSESTPRRFRKRDRKERPS